MGPMRFGLRKAVVAVSGDAAANERYMPLHHRPDLSKLTSTSFPVPVPAHTMAIAQRSIGKSLIGKSLIKNQKSKWPSIWIRDVFCPAPNHKRMCFAQHQTTGACFLPSTKPQAHVFCPAPMVLVAKHVSNPA